MENWTVVGRGYFSPARSHSENVASSRWVTQSMRLTVESLKDRAVGKIRQEIDSLKASLLDLKKVRRNLKVPKFYFKETWHCDIIDDLGLKTTQRRRFL